MWFPVVCPCLFFFFFSSRRRHTRFKCDWSSDVCSSDLYQLQSFRFQVPGLKLFPLREEVRSAAAPASSTESRHHRRLQSPQTKRNYKTFAAAELLSQTERATGHSRRKRIRAALPPRLASSSRRCTCKRRESDRGRQVPDVSGAPASNPQSALRQLKPVRRNNPPAR